MIDRRTIRSLLLAMACAVGFALPVQGATAPDGSVVRVIATDIDRDGDLDVLASTDRDLFVWINDGDGRLISQTMKPHPLVANAPPRQAWNDAGPRDDETFQDDDVPSSRLPGDSVHAPPSSVGESAFAADASLRAHAARGSRTPRAPPIAIRR